jgi:hypothetical protein
LSVPLSPQQKTWDNLYPDFSLSMQSSDASSSKCKLHISHILECSIFDQQVCNCTPNIVLVHGLHTHINTHWDTTDLLSSCRLIFFLWILCQFQACLFDV